MILQIEEVVAILDYQNVDNKDIHMYLGNNLLISKGL